MGAWCHKILSPSEAAAIARYRLFYAEESFGIYDLDDYSSTIMDLDHEPKAKLKETLEKQKRVRLSREDPRQRIH